MNINCTLCKKEIKNYHSDFHHFPVDENNSAEICPECLDKLIKWQRGVYAKLFPTKTIKKFIRPD